MDEPMLTAMHSPRIEAHRPASERARLDRHFRRVLRVLRARPVASLRSAQRRARARHIEALDAYRRRGRFPRNLGRAVPFPIFVDDVGTRCAMAHLIEGADGGDLVRSVADTRNEARIHELADSDALLTWLVDNGLTVEEAALIQPAYCMAASECLCFTPTTILEGDVTGESTMSVTEVFGADVGVNVGDDVEFFALSFDKVVNVGDSIYVDPGTTWVVGLADANGDVLVSNCPPAASAPGPLPEIVFSDALLAGNLAECASILEAHDPAWTQEQGDCNPVVGAGGQGSGGAGGATTGGSPSGPTVAESGCSYGAPGAVPSVVLTMMAGALVLLRLRRR